MKDLITNLKSTTHDLEAGTATVGAVTEDLSQSLCTMLGYAISVSTEKAAADYVIQCFMASSKNTLTFLQDTRSEKFDGQTE